MNRRAACPLALGLLFAACLASGSALAENALGCVDQQGCHALVAAGQAAAFGRSLASGDAVSQVEPAADPGVCTGLGDGRRLDLGPRAELTGSGDRASPVAIRESVATDGVAGPGDAGKVSCVLDIDASDPTGPDADLVARPPGRSSTHATFRSVTGGNEPGYPPVIAGERRASEIGCGQRRYTEPVD